MKRPKKRAEKNHDAKARKPITITHCKNCKEHTTSEGLTSQDSTMGVENTKASVFWMPKCIFNIDVVVVLI